MCFVYFGSPGADLKFCLPGCEAGIIRRGTHKEKWKCFPFAFYYFRVISVKIALNNNAWEIGIWPFH